jgi:hypothetical protein
VNPRRLTKRHAPAIAELRFLQAAGEMQDAVIDKPDARCALQTWEATGEATGEPTKHLPTRHEMKRTVAAILSSPVLQQPMVLPTGRDGGCIILDGSCWKPPQTSDRLRVGSPSDRRSRWAQRFADEEVSDDAYAAACWIMKRRAPIAGIKPVSATPSIEASKVDRPRPECAGSCTT